MDIKFIKELGSGGNGTAYLVKRGNEKLVYKLERMDVFDEDKPLQSEYYRQVDFNKNIAVHHPDKFLVLKSQGIIIDCEYVHPKHEEFMKHFGKERKRRYVRKNSQPNCYFLLYSPYLDGSFVHVRNRIHKSPKLFLDFMYQIISSINIMRKKGYSQNDYGPNNIMYKKIGNKYQWYLIDYGNICHKKFPISELDKDIRGKISYCLDLFQFVITCCFNRDSINKFIKKYNLKQFNNSELRKNIKKESEYKEIIKHIPSSTKKELFDEIVLFIVKILYPFVFFKCAGVPEKIYKKYKNKQLYPELLVYCLKHHTDKSYISILNKIKKLSL